MITTIDSHGRDWHFFMSELKYLSGFGNEFATEAIPGTLPEGQNNPQQCAYGLYCEQLSGTAFTAPRAKNNRTWLYRIRPSVIHGDFSPIPHRGFLNPTEYVVDPNQHRWMPQPLPEGEVDFLDGISAVCGSGDPASKSGLAIYLYGATKSMGNRVMHNSDGDFLIVPQQGALTIKTEMGILHVESSEIVVIQRGIKFSVNIDGPSRGYILEVFSGHFILPDLGPIGANGLANPRDFLTPVAAYEDLEGSYTLVNKYAGLLFSCSMEHSPFDVVGWHGNYAPYKYDLRKFCCMNSVTFDHPVTKRWNNYYYSS
jgi:homogentisate 1,2-dioxygenase